MAGHCYTWVDLHEAVTEDNIALVRTILGEGTVNINELGDIDNKGTVLHNAVIRGHTDIVMVLCSVKGVEVGLTYSIRMGGLLYTMLPKKGTLI